MADSISKHPIHLGLGATAVKEPEFDGTMEWFQGYGQRHDADGAEGRIVMMNTFTESWTMWEMHPEGHEVVLCTAGKITLIQEKDGNETRVTLEPGQYAINEPGTWHTADIEQSATAVFITAGKGTDHRPR